MAPTDLEERRFAAVCAERKDIVHFLLCDATVDACQMDIWGNTAATGSQKPQCSKISRLFLYVICQVFIAEFVFNV
jgi:hypothetical protein